MASNESLPEETEELRPLLDNFILAIVTLLARLAWLIPWPFWSVLATLGGLLTMFTKRRREVLANVRHARAGSQPHPIVAWWIGSQQIATHLRAVSGTLRAAHRIPSAASLQLEGLEAVRPYLGQRGIIIVSAHAGPYTLLGLMSRRWLAQQGFQGELAIVARMFRPFRSGALMQWFMDYFTAAGINVISVHEQPQVMAKRLRSVLENKGIVVLLVDEPTPTPSAVVPFFDSGVKMPIGPVRLAKATGALLVPTLASYERGGKMKVTLSSPIEPQGPVTADLERVARALQEMISRNIGQWGMLTDIWIDPNPDAPDASKASAGHSYADLHLHTRGSDGLLHAEEWVPAARANGITLLGITDHDHIETVRAWKLRDPEGTRHVVPGVELTARGRIVHLGVLFAQEIPARLPKPGTPLLDLMRWARGIEGSVVVLVHPLPVLWRRQLRQMARAGLLPDAIESRFPYGGNGKRTAEIERAARRFNLAVLGSSDSHLSPGQIGTQATLFPGETVEDFFAALRARQTQAVSLPRDVRIPGSVTLLQTAYSWLLPFRAIPGVPPLRNAILRRARTSVGLEAPACRAEAPVEPSHQPRTPVS